MTGFTVYLPGGNTEDHGWWKSSHSSPLRLLCSFCFSTYIVCRPEHVVFRCRGESGLYRCLVESQEVPTTGFTFTCPGATKFFTAREWKLVSTPASQCCNKKLVFMPKYYSICNRSWVRIPAQSGLTLRIITHKWEKSTADEIHPGFKTHGQNHMKPKTKVPGAPQNGLQSNKNVKKIQLKHLAGYLCRIGRQENSFL